MDSRTPGERLDFTYSARDRLVQVTRGPPGSETVLGQFDYNHEGMRVRHWLSDRGNVLYYHDDGAVLVERNADDGSLLAYYEYADRLIALAQPLGKQYYHHDALGSTIGLTDAAGNDAKSYHLDPWGNIRWETGSSINRHVFTGKEHDPNTGLVYFGARYYDPEVGRFITQDTYLGDENEPPSLNRYLYAYSNPTVFIDPTGNQAMMGFATSFALDRVGNAIQWAATKDTIEFADTSATPQDPGEMIPGGEGSRVTCIGSPCSSSDAVLTKDSRNGSAQTVPSTADRRKAVARKLAALGPPPSIESSSLYTPPAGVEEFYSTTYAEAAGDSESTGMRVSYGAAATLSAIPAFFAGAIRGIGNVPAQAETSAKRVAYFAARATILAEEGFDEQALIEAGKAVEAGAEGFIATAAEAAPLTTAGVAGGTLRYRKPGIQSGPVKRMAVEQSGHHVPAVRKSVGRPFAIGRSDKTRPTLSPRGDDPAHAHWMLHRAEKKHIGPRQGSFAGTDDELFNAYRRAYEGLDDIRVDVKSPDGKFLLGENVTPGEAVDLVEDWLKKRGER